jgi:hypothetical protein
MNEDSTQTKAARNKGLSLEARLSRAATELDTAAARYETWGHTNSPAPRRRNVTRLAIWGATVASVVIVSGSVIVARNRVTAHDSVVDQSAAAPSPSIAASAPLKEPDFGSTPIFNGEPTVDSIPALVIPPGPVFLSTDPANPPEIRFQLKTVTEVVVSAAGPGPHLGYFRARKGQTVTMKVTEVPTKPTEQSPKKASKKSDLKPGSEPAPRVVTVTSRDTGELVGTFQLPGSDVATLPLDGTYLVSLDGEAELSFQLEIK